LKPDAGRRLHNRVKKKPPRRGGRKPKKDQPPKKDPEEGMSKWEKQKHDENAKTCQVTYTCRYGLGFDEICDNQRWAIERGWGGKKVFHFQSRGAGKDYDKDDWSNLYRDDAYRTRAVAKVGKKKQRFRCEVDEFPLGSLKEGRQRGRQHVRFVNGQANGAQGMDIQC
jgi:chitinase